MTDPVAFAAARLADDERELEADPPQGLGYAVLPWRVRREIEAGKRILARHGRKHWCPTGPQDDEWVTYEAGERVVSVYPCADMLDLLYRWRDHPEYDESWKPAREPDGR